MKRQQQQLIVAPVEDEGLTFQLRSRTCIVDSACNTLLMLNGVLQNPQSTMLHRGVLSYNKLQLLRCFVLIAEVTSHATPCLLWQCVGADQRNTSRNASIDGSDNSIGSFRGFCIVDLHLAF